MTFASNAAKAQTLHDETKDPRHYGATVHRLGGLLSMASTDAMLLVDPVRGLVQENTRGCEFSLGADQLLALQTDA